jgi:hypothetical protein
VVNLIKGYIMKNPIPKVGFFATKSIGELQEYVESMNGKEKALAYTILCMTLNACHKAVEDAEAVCL